MTVTIGAMMKGTLRSLIVYQSQNPVLLSIDIVRKKMKRKKMSMKAIQVQYGMRTVKTRLRFPKHILG
ncbi:hypothetical protein D3C80_1976280 [compost metagenome]